MVLSTDYLLLAKQAHTEVTDMPIVGLQKSETRLKAVTWDLKWKNGSICQLLSFTELKEEHHTNYYPNTTNENCYFKPTLKNLFDLQYASTRQSQFSTASCTKAKSHKF